MADIDERPAGRATAHPTPATLAAFLEGRLSPAELDAVEPHISSCDECCAVLRQLPPDPLAQKLRTGEAGSTEQIDPRESLAGHPRYHLLEPLGSGGMGTVYKARHLLMDRVVAVKVIHLRLLRNPRAVERFVREFKAAGRLKHPNIVIAHDADRAGDCHFLVMEFVEGTSLAALVADHGPLSVGEACGYVRQAALGLQHAFEHGMVHRDIKPQNLMLTPQGQIKILDFGLAHIIDDDTPRSPASGDTEEVAAPAGLTRASTVLGTPDYMAPEQTTDSRAVDVRTDVYALGCTLYYLLAGRPPFPEGTTADKLAAHRDRQPTPLSEVRPDIPPDLAAVVARMLAKDPARRYHTPAEVAAALRPFAEDEPRTPRWRRRGFLVAGVALLAGGAVAAPFLWKRRQPEQPTPPSPDGNAGPVAPPAPKANPDEVWKLEGHSGHVWSVAFSPDGRRALSSSQDGTIRLWDLEAGREDGAAIIGHRWAICVPSLSPKGDRVLVGYDQGKVRDWDLATRKAVRELAGHTALVEAAAYSPDGSRALTASDERTIRFWDMTNGTVLHQFDVKDSLTRSIAFSPDGRRALCAGAEYLLLLDLDRKQIVWEVTESLPYMGMKSANKPRGGPGQITHPLFQPKPPPELVLPGVCFSPNGASALVSILGGIALRDAETGKPIRVYKPGPGERHLLDDYRFPGAGNGVALSPDGRRAVSGGDGVVVLWDVETGIELKRFRGHAGNVWCVAFSSDGKRALSGGQDGTVRLWNVGPQ